MIEYQGMQFANTIGVLFNLKEQLGFTTLQESYKYLERDDLDCVINVLRSAFNWNRTEKVDEPHFLALLAEKHVGALKLIEIYSQVVQAILTDGLSAEEIEQRKNVARELR